MKDGEAGNGGFHRHKADWLKVEWRTHIQWLRKKRAPAGSAELMGSWGTIAFKHNKHEWEGGHFVLTPPLHVWNWSHNWLRMRTALTLPTTRLLRIPGISETPYLIIWHILLQSLKLSKFLTNIFKISNSFFPYISVSSQVCCFTGECRSQMITSDVFLWYCLPLFFIPFIYLIQTHSLAWKSLRKLSCQANMSQSLDYKHIPSSHHLSCRVELMLWKQASILPPGHLSSTTSPPPHIFFLYPASIFDQAGQELLTVERM